ncbi:MAG: DUF2849 domain-containing protein [Alphaproteobacteria bacterium]|nr:DUF2849 domain-containing protein [Alphaproteobacteria bacterium]
MAEALPLMVTANRLTDGAVVYLTHSGDWSERPAASSVAGTREEHAHLLDTARQRGALAAVIEPTAVPITSLDRPQPASLRERIRRHGPTVRPDLARA